MCLACNFFLLFRKKFVFFSQLSKSRPSRCAHSDRVMIANRSRLQQRVVVSETEKVNKSLAWLRLRPIGQLLVSPSCEKCVRDQHSQRMTLLNGIHVTQFTNPMGFDILLSAYDGGNLSTESSDKMFLSQRRSKYQLSSIKT